MNYQESILKQYRRAFPDRTLKSISLDTGIQMTRVFRLFNGSEMKLKEYEAFERSLKSHSLASGKFELLTKFQNCLANLPDKDLAFMEIEIEHLIKTRNFISKRFIESANFAVASPQRA